MIGADGSAQVPGQYESAARGKRHPRRGQFMNPATRTTTPRNAMRVATVFTAAAAAAVAFAPGAMAGTGHTPTQNHLTPAGGKTRAATPDLHSGSIRSAGCTTNTWLHIQYASPPFRTLCKAFGFRGVMSPDSAVSMSAQCGGNNSGDIYYGGGEVLAYGPGTTYRTFSPHKIVSLVSISTWHGTDKCAWPR